MYVIDVNTSFGKRVDTDRRYSLSALSDELDRHDVACALCYSQQGVEYDPRAGNAETIAAAKANPRILPVGTLDPRDTPGWERELDRCRAAGVRVLRFFPGLQSWSVDSCRFRSVLKVLQGSRMCLVFDTKHCPSGWELSGMIARLTGELDLPVILTDTSYGNMSETMAVMQEYQHVYAEINWLATVDAVGIMADAVGADRLLHGSSAPWRPMQKALNQVLETGLSEGDKAAILGGNAVRLLDVSPEQLAARPQLTDLQPKRFQEPSIDIHSHLGYWYIPCRDEDYDPGAMLQRMRRYGIERSIVSAYESMRYDIAAGNRALVNAIQGHPELLGYVELTPHDLALSCAEMDRYYALPNMVGCELELSHIPCPTGSNKVRALMAEIARRRRPILLMPASSADVLAERDLARENPRLAIIHAHGADAEWGRAVKDTPNLYVEFCSSHPNHHALRDCLDILGPERVLFGTDQTLLSVGGQVGLFLDALMTSQERHLVLYENARRLFGLKE